LATAASYSRSAPAPDATGAEHTEEVTDHPLTQLLNNPNPFMGRFAF
jgi:hypothetical protein